MFQINLSQVAKEITGLSPDALQILREAFAEYIEEWRDKVLEISNEDAHGNLSAIATATRNGISVDTVLKHRTEDK